MIRNSSWRRALLTAGAAVTALALTAPSAGAATAKFEFSGAAEALTLDLAISDPLGLLSAVSGNEAGLQQRVSRTSASLSTVGERLAVSTLLEGDLMTDSIGSSTDQEEGRKVLVEQDLGIAKVSAGLMEFSVNENVSASKSQLAEVSVGLSSVLDGALPAADAAQLTETVDQAVGVVEGLVGQLNGVLGEVEEVVEQVDDAAPVDLPELSVTELPTISASDLLSTDASLVYVEKLVSDTRIERTASAVTSTATASIVKAELLGGLVEVPAFSYTCRASANGLPGGAVAEGDTQHIAVKVANNDAVSIADGTLKVGDISLDLAALGVDAAKADSLLADVDALLGQIVSAAGLDVAEGVVKEDAAADGSRAECATSAFVISLAPLNALTSVLGEHAAAASELQATLNLLPTKAVAAAQPVPPPADEPPAPAPNLPRTGGGAVAILFGAIAMVGALGLRKR